MLSTVSVIIPFFNNPKQLEKALKSIRFQTYREIEVVVVDDGSEEDYEDLVNSFKPFFNVKYIKQVNQGPGLARQNGLKNSSGNYIQYLDSDDTIYPNKLKTQVEILEANPQVIMVYGLSTMNGDSKQIHRKSNFKGNENDVAVSAIQKRKWHTSSCLWRYDTSKVYWEDLKNGEDVLHDVNAGLYNKNKAIIFKNDLVSDITMSDDPRHLSNAVKNINKHKQIVRDATELNHRIYQKLKHLKLHKKKAFIKPLCERYFFEGLKFIKLNYKENGLMMLNKGFNISKSLYIKLEFRLTYMLFKYNVLNANSVKRVFKVHKLLCSKAQHQFRNL